LGLLLVGSVTAALAGQVGAPTASPIATATAATSGSGADGSAARWVDQVLATTRAAGSAQFGYRTVTRSSIAAFDSSVSGHGVVDFARRRASLTEVQSPATQVQGPQEPHAIPVAQVNQTRTITIGKSTWEQIDSPFGGNRWIEFPMPALPTDHLRLPLGASEALIGVEGAEPVVGVRTVGPATIDGVRTTHYRLVTARPHPCTAAQAAALRGNVTGPTDLWVDGHGRLVQATLAIHADVQAPAPGSGIARSSAVPTAALVTTATLRLGHFGVPVHITAPTNVVSPASSKSFAIGLHACH
jgi:hypothetical protein